MCAVIDHIAVFILTFADVCARVCACRRNGHARGVPGERQQVWLHRQRDHRRLQALLHSHQYDLLPIHIPHFYY